MRTTYFLLPFIFVRFTSVDRALANGSSSSRPDVLPRADFRFPGSVGRTYREFDKPQFPEPVKAPRGGPNVVLILIDDEGFGQFSAFGGGVPAPTLDKLAAEGLRFNCFHTMAAAQAKAARSP